MNDLNHDTVSTRYVLGHSERELNRLQAQARLIGPITERFFREAGIDSGMRVLDVGCGAGDVSFLAADIVGEGGEVVAVDRAPAAIELARARAVARARRNVIFLEGDPCELAFDKPFDAVIGRYVLMFQKDPAAMLRKLAAHARPGGLIAFHEIDWGGITSCPAIPTFERCLQWGAETLRLSGAETRMGRNLYSTFVSAGLPPPSMRLEALIRGAAHNADLLHLFAELMATLLPDMERLGVASGGDIGLETLLARMSEEAVAHASVVIGHYQIGAWSRV